ncbi:WSC domain-containing protein [Stachybotrys elegans]|uniref:WSC domain-containing protein n=1 Tax=Stachybotrys elegans TaxID=80388 RepID=A0A8K0SN37_9HYPO|nr:WSC domain-containing protein [Stachybotrys elegans]
MKAAPCFPALATFLVALVSVPRAVCTSTSPSLQFDPDTISPCVMWEDNANDLVCEDVRENWGITPEEFSEWNPSVGLDCKPWRIQSYCVVPLKRLPVTTTSSQTSKTTTTTSTSSTSTLGPSPTSWSSLGCYTDENPKYSALKQRLSDAAGDKNLTIAACQDTCYKASFIFAGVKAGKECWCSDNVLGDLAVNATDCNIPCTGDKTSMCGGSKRLNVFEPVDDFWNEDVAETTAQMESGQPTAVSDTDSSASLHSRGGCMSILLLITLGYFELMLL